MDFLEEYTMMGQYMKDSILMDAEFQVDILMKMEISFINFTDNNLL